ncbi:GDP-mannose 4,6-dehydratase [Azoarcus sp. KH32C]|uniref:GDP-mannose 4,6-dehydratase n=1 Tax=Azoarcus sp. KH32C TaxID=748247 RepID=UPI00023866A7|nr:GDP-mannose 4,6-dehydratase [Azoarcus sp. KH32C]BAL22584.1 GDP-mannose 4,6-dehydratase [Azoarcus sp. KH32C]
MSDSPVKTALITGIGGQDGAYLARYLLGKGYRVIGTSRDARAKALPSLDRLGIAEQVAVISMMPQDFKSTLASVDEVRPDEIYHLAGQSSVGASFERPAETVESVALGTLNLLESVRQLRLPARLFHASSGECFGNTGGMPADERTPFAPASPYGVAKAAAHMLARNYREAYGLFVASGLLFNHESPLRPGRFVTQKIVQGAMRIAHGSREVLSLGALTIVRDWGWAPEYVEAMWHVLQADQADDFIIATGEPHSLEDFVAQAFAYFGLEWRKHVRFEEGLVRPNEIPWSHGNPAKAEALLGWRARNRMREVVKLLCEDALQAHNQAL